MAFSYADPQELICLECGSPFTAPVWMIIGGDDPILFRRVAQDTIHCFKCPAGHPRLVTAPLIVLLSDGRSLFSPAKGMSRSAEVEQQLSEVAGILAARAPHLRKRLKRSLEFVAREFLALSIHSPSLVELVRITYAASSPSGQVPDPRDQSLMLSRSLSLLPANEVPMLWATLLGRLAEAVYWAHPHDASAREAAARMCTDIVEELVTHDEPYRLALAKQNLAMMLGRSPEPHDHDLHFRALRLLEEARLLFGARSFPRELGICCFNISIECYKAPPDLQIQERELAISALEEAIAILTPADDPRLWGDLNQQLGVFRYERQQGIRGENLRIAIQAYERALLARTQSAAPEKWVLTQMDLGNAWLAMMEGDILENVEQAIQTYSIAADFARRIGQLHSWARLQSNLCNAYMARLRGDRRTNLGAAIEAGRAASAALEREVHGPDWGRLNQNLGNAYAELAYIDHSGDLSNAISAYREALAVRDPQSSKADWLATANNLADAYRRSGGFGDERGLLQAQLMRMAADLSPEVPRHLWASILCNLATDLASSETGDALHNNAQAIEFFSKSILYAREAGNYKVIRRSALRLYAIKAKLGQWEECYWELSSVIEQLEEPFAGVYTTEGKEGVAERNALVYQALVESSIRTDRLREALLLVERASGSVLSDEVLQLQLPAPGVSANLLKDEREALQQVRQLDLLIRRLSDVEERRRASTEINSARIELERIWLLMEDVQEAKAYVRLRRGGALSWDEVQEWLAVQTCSLAVAVYFQLPERWVVLTLRKGWQRPIVTELSMSDGELQQAVSQFLHDLEGRKDCRHSSAVLFRTLVEPIETALPCDVLCVAPHGILHFLPLQALSSAMGKMLLEQCAVQYTASIGILLSRGAALERPASTQVAVVGNPTEDLKFADIEARWVAQKFLSSPLLRAEAASSKLQLCLQQRTLHTSLLTRGSTRSTRSGLG